MAEVEADVAGVGGGAVGAGFEDEVAGLEVGEACDWGADVGLLLGVRGGGCRSGRRRFG